MPGSFDMQELEEQMEKIKRIIKKEGSYYEIKDMNTAKPSEERRNNDFERMCFMARYDTGFRNVLVKYVMVTLEKRWEHYGDYDAGYNIHCQFFGENKQTDAEKTWERRNKNLYY
jgi:hypothetical protein